MFEMATKLTRFNFRNKRIVLEHQMEKLIEMEMTMRHP